MAQQPSPARERLRGTFPKMIEIADDVIYGDIWERPGLSKRDRSLIVVATLLSMSTALSSSGAISAARWTMASRRRRSPRLSHISRFMQVGLPQ